MPTELSPEHTDTAPTFAAFANHRLVAAGPRDEVLRNTKKHLDRGGAAVLIFEDSSGRQVDFDFRGSVDEVLARSRETLKVGPGRPKLGVVSREVSLLPRHWDWLESQPNGASAAIRRLVDEARHNETGAERGRHVRNAISKFLWSMAGDLPNFEDAARALHAREDARLAELISAWPKDIQDHVARLLARAVAMEAW